MPSENLIIARILNVLSWVVLGVGAVLVALAFCFLPEYSLERILPPVAGGCAVVLGFIVLNVLARILRTVTYLYSMTWEQLAQISDDIDMLDGEKDNLDQSCPYCGAANDPGSAACRQCGKALPSSGEANN